MLSAPAGELHGLVAVLDAASDEANAIAAG
jgi:hypothetical protein